MHAYLNYDYNKGIWTSIFIAINIIQIFIIYRDRQELTIPEQIRDLYENIFHTNSSREFLHFWDQGQLHYSTKEKILSAGDKQADLMLILNGAAHVIRDDERIATLERGQFIAEISYITGKPASADVVSQEELSYYVWDRNNNTSRPHIVSVSLSWPCGS